ncbi:MAG: hypothetical protein OXH04_23625, partial [Acidobacteria bacterium]|nr:hypothetical protein [Acidobacteriota bacterium]
MSTNAKGYANPGLLIAPDELAVRLVRRSEAAGSSGSEAAGNSGSEAAGSPGSAASAPVVLDVRP